MTTTSGRRAPHPLTASSRCPRAAGRWIAGIGRPAMATIVSCRHGGMSRRHHSFAAAWGTVGGESLTYWAAGALADNMLRVHRGVVTLLLCLSAVWMLKQGTLNLRVHPTVGLCWQTAPRDSFFALLLLESPLPPESLLEARCTALQSESWKLGPAVLDW